MIAESWQIREQFRVIEEAVPGTQLPFFATTTFHGEFESDALFDTTLDWRGNISGLTTPSVPIAQNLSFNSDLTVTSTQIVTYDTQVSGSTQVRSLNFRARFNEFDWQVQKGDIARAKVRAVLVAPHTETQTSTGGVF